jgi:hypothetical protein
MRTKRGSPRRGKGLTAKDAKEPEPSAAKPQQISAALGDAQNHEHHCEFHTGLADDPAWMKLLQWGGRAITTA